VASFTVSVVLPEPDRYVATVILMAAGAAPQAHELAIRVGSEPAPSNTLSVERVGPHDAEATGDRALLALGVHNTSAIEHSFAVSPPVVTRKQGTHALPADVGVRLVPPAAAGTTLRIAGGATGVLQVEVFDAPPGNYAVDVQLGQPGMASATISGEVFVKRGIAWAILIIAIGVLLASAISRLRDVWLDSQAQRINLGQVLERLQLEPSGDAARDALHELRRQGEDIARAITDRRDTRADIESLGRRAVVFARANASAAEVTELGEGRREELRRKLDEVFRLVELPSGEADATDKLSELENRDAERQELKAALEALVASIADHRLEADSTLSELLTGIATRIEHVRALYERDEIAAAEHEVKALRTALDRAGRDAVQRACDGVPPWTSRARWTQAVAQIKVLLASPEASYDTVHTAFVDASVALTVQEVKHPETAALAAATDLSVKLRLLAKIHAESTSREESAEEKDVSLSVVAGLFTASPHRVPGATKGGGAAPREAFEWRTLARRSTRVEALLLSVVMAVAVVAGVKALWIDNATWGSWGDLLAAFLWGSGVQVGAEAFVGLAALRAAIGRRL
jgi:hypothetical protein